MKILKIEGKIKRASYFKEVAGFNYEEYTGNIRTMFQHISLVVAPLCPTEYVSYLINGIKASNDEMNMGKIIVKTASIGMATDFEAAVINISNFIP